MKEKPKNPAVTVRPKASQRKGRSAVIARTARAPSQGRSQRRFDEILDATQSLLESARIEDISFYDIAQKAGMSPASVHYLFPSMAAVRLELSRRYNLNVIEKIAEVAAELAKAGEPSWQQWTRVMADVARQSFNSSRPLAEIILGPVLNHEGRLANIESNVVVGSSVVATLNASFVVPEIPNLEMMFSLSSEIFDALWSRSYVLHGQIDDETFEESMRVVLSYMRTVLPERLTLRVVPGQQAQGTSEHTTIKR